MPARNASATTAGTGACESTVDGLTVLAAQFTYDNAEYCGLVIYSGPGTWTVPSGVTAVNVELIGGGGGAGNFGGGGGGEPVQVDGHFSNPDVSTFAVTPGQSIAVSIGAGGTGGNHITAPTNGGDTTFGTLTAKGGGYGGSWNPSTGVGTAGGAGGNGGGGAPTAASESSPAVVAGEVGGLATSAVGNSGGAGAGTMTGGKYALAGGGGGGVRMNFVVIDASVSGLPYSPNTKGGNGGFGIIPPIIENVDTRDYSAWLGSIGFGGGGGGGIALSIGGGYAPGNNGAFPNTGGTQSEIGSISIAPETSNPNTGQGGAGGGSLDGSRMGSNGASGIAAIAWRLPGGAGSPSAPTNVNGNPGTNSADVDWTAPADDGGSAISDYGVEFSTDGGATWSPASRCSGTALACTVTGLTNGTAYIFRVSATNANGTGPWSDPSRAVIPGTGPRFAG